jgi:DNA polymerase
MDWPSLAHTIGTCQACKLCLGRKAAVLAAADAAAAADWLVVGEPPEEQDERLATPFAGQSGQLLDNMLRAVGVSRHGAYAAGAAATRPRSELAYVTHCVKCRPAIARNPEPAELATCESYLRREVALVQPKVILALGRFAAQTLLQGTLPEVASIPLGKLRGQVYRYQQIPVIVSYPTSYLLRAPQDKARAWADLCLAMAAKAA